MTGESKVKTISNYSKYLDTILQTWLLRASEESPYRSFDTLTVTAQRSFPSRYMLSLAMKEVL